MNISQFKKVALSAIVMRNSVDFSLEIIAYTPHSTMMARYLASMDNLLVPQSLHLLCARTFEFEPATSAFTSEPLAHWDPDHMHVLTVSPNQCFYIAQPTDALKVAFMDAVPMPDGFTYFGAPTTPL